MYVSNNIDTGKDIERRVELRSKNYDPTSTYLAKRDLRKSEYQRVSIRQYC